MTDLMNKTARIAVIALLSAAPVAAFADVETGSPAQSIANDPDEYAESDGPLTDDAGESLEDTARSDQGEDAYEDTDLAEDVDGSLIEDDAKRDG
ncbi:hypothetical protein KDD17_08625 [Sulfitobacter albidus]|uniref:Pentapeptide repeat-containing protein n=1 Tax=Sulfitobacter albidus TaxID=2829501 RepID=A0A975JB40_9RHOB|nr:hypothetical protein [Sulfitobacter albidus]QUJ75102.1 hypothetical protein KDD17_08625 [Sulfitobacter albidus]